MRWQEYWRDVVCNSTGLYDGIITDPPYNLPQNPNNTGSGYLDMIDNEEIDLFAQFCRRMLKSGSYVYIFTSFHLFERWSTAFKKSKFSCIKYPFVIGKIRSLCNTGT